MSNLIKKVADNATVGDNLPLIMTLAMLQEKNYKIGRLAGNRNLDPKNVKAKEKSLKETGLLVPAIIVDAKKALDERLEVVDFETGEPVTESNADKYVVLVDANHRYQAHINLKKEDGEYKKEFYFSYPLQEDIQIVKMLSEINIATNAWKAVDYGKGAEMLVKEKLPLLIAINELTSRGFSLEAASKWLTGESKVTKTVMVNAMNGQISDELRKDYRVEDGKRLLASAMKSFPEKFLTSRILPDWINSKLNEYSGTKAEFFKEMNTFLSSLGRVQGDKINDLKGKRGGDTKETLVNRELTSLWTKRDEIKV